MANLTEMELQELRHLVGEELLAQSKDQFYAQSCNDAQLKAQFQKGAQQHQQNAQKLMQFLNV